MPRLLVFFFYLNILIYILNRTTCNQENCKRKCIPSNLTQKKHDNMYHRSQHTIQYQSKFSANTCIFNPKMLNTDQKIIIQRNPETQLLPCPCSAPQHAWLNFYLVNHLCRSKEHPAPDAQIYLDEPEYPLGQFLQQPKSKKKKTKQADDCSNPSSAQKSTTNLTLTESLSSLHLTSTSNHNDDPSNTLSALASLDNDDNISLTDMPEDSSNESKNDNQNILKQPIDDIPTINSDSAIVEETNHRLLGYLLRVDPNYNRIICLICYSLVPFQRIHAHAHKHTQETNHFLPPERRIPSQEILQDLFWRLNAHQPLSLGNAPIPPFEGIPVTVEYQCMLPECLKENIIFSEKKRIFIHFNQHHPSYTIHDQPIKEVLCQPLSTYKNERVYQEVIYMP